MAYIGREPQIGNYQICDAISVVNGQAAYTMQVSSTNVIPESVNHMIVSLNGVIQKPGSSYTISSSTITFSSNLATGDSIDFIYLLGNVLDLGTPSDDTVTGAKIVDNAINSEHYTDGSIDTAHIADLNVTTGKIAADAITGAKIADNAIDSEHYTDGSIDTAHIAADQITEAKIADNAISEEHLDVTAITGHTAETSIADGDTILIHDASASALRKMTKSNFVSGIGGVNTPAFSARLSSSLALASTSTVDVVFQTERFDVGGCYNNSTGVFEVPSGEGGKYFINARCTFLDGNGNMSRFILYMHSTISSSASQDVVDQSDNTSDGTLFVERTLQSTSILSLSAGDQIKFQVYQQTNNNSGASLRHGNRYTEFMAFKLIE